MDYLIMNDTGYNFIFKELRRLVFSGMVACSTNELYSRNYPSAVIKGDDLHIVCRSADEHALNPQYNNMITHHIVSNFRQLIY